MTVCPVCRQPLVDSAAAAKVDANLKKYLAVEKQSHDREKRALEAQVLAAQRAAKKGAAEHGRRLLQVERQRHRLDVERAKGEAKREEQRRQQRERQQADTRMIKLQGEIEHYRRQLEKYTSDERGDLREAEVLEDLRRAFPDDIIQPIGKRRGDADIRHDVRDGAKVCGTIVYECKNVSGWNSAWINQARTSKAKHKAGFVLIVSNSFPRGQKYLCVIREVPVVHATIVTHVVRYVRQALIVAAGTTSTPLERQRKADQLLEYMSAGDFGENMKTIAEALKDLRDLQDKEQAAHRRTWQHQAARFDIIDTGTSRIQMRVDGIIRGTRVAAVPEAAVG